MKILFLSSKQCENQDANNGDCIIIDTGNELIIYDCGCEDYANYILRYMKNNEYEKIKIVLYNGIRQILYENKDKYLVKFVDIYCRMVWQIMG